MATNLRGVWLLARAEIKAMLASGRAGSIVNTSSFVAEAATPGMSAYAPSKAGVNALVRALALEAGPHGVRVNNVAPGVTRTAMSEGLSDELNQALADQAALKRVAEPSEIASVAVWLCTEEARFVTGQTILADGGYAIPGLREPVSRRRVRSQIRTNGPKAPRAKPHLELANTLQLARSRVIWPPLCEEPVRWSPPPGCTPFLRGPRARWRNCHSAL